MVNNLSASNLEAKAKELAGVLEAGSYPWFANYMVVKRAAQEPNFHGIYLQAGPVVVCVHVMGQSLDESLLVPDMPT